MRISEASRASGLSLDTLRYYERIGLIPPVARKNGGIRDYSELDLRRVEFIKCMRRAGLPIETLITYYGLVQQGDHTMEARKEILYKQRDQLLDTLEEIQETLDLVNHKLNVYESALAQKEQAILQNEG